MRCSRVSHPFKSLHICHTYSLCTSAPGGRLLVQASHLPGSNILQTVPYFKVDCESAIQLSERHALIYFLLFAADSSVPYLKPYYDRLPDWQPPLDPRVKPVSGQKREARLPVGWVMGYRHLSGKGYHPRPFDQGVSKNLEHFFFTPKPYCHKAQFEPGDMVITRAPGLNQV